MSCKFMSRLLLSRDTVFSDRTENCYFNVQFSKTLLNTSYKNEQLPHSLQNRLLHLLKHFSTHPSIAEGTLRRLLLAWCLSSQSRSASSLFYSLNGIFSMSPSILETTKCRKDSCLESREIDERLEFHISPRTSDWGVMNVLGALSDTTFSFSPSRNL